MKKILFLTLFLLLLCGCTRYEPVSTSIPAIPPTSIPSNNVTVPQFIAEESSLTAPASQPSSSETRTYASGKPYQEWGTPTVLSFSLESGTDYTITVNLPVIDQEHMPTSRVWRGNYDNGSQIIIAVMEHPKVTELKQFFDDHSEAICSDFQDATLIHKDAALKVSRREILTLEDKDAAMVQGTLTYQNGETIFLGIAIPLSDGNYIYILAPGGTNWATVKEVAENAARTLRE
ncbi:MAG TPA: hypothetical protein IAC31_07935 [Candidatus Faecousia intestinigallinarum]|nr:hypothetical protein [Candidatus Faecousia intestinigallinarum]